MSRADMEFEQEVVRIAQALWPTSEIAGQVVLEGRERDGVFVTEEIVHLLECTTSTKKDKASYDAEKLAKLIKSMRQRYPSKGVKGWFITQNPPTADQKSVITQYHNDIYACSIAEFRNKLIDATSYLEARLRYPFGSMRDPDTGKHPIEMDDFKYVSIDIVARDQVKWSASEISDGLLGGNDFLLLGDYGIGKSTTLREIFQYLRKKYFLGQAAKFPVLLNLRDHHGQTNPAEALERHARNVGYANSSHLVRAWRAGYVLLLLDGFDEIAIAGWTGEVVRLREIRRKSMELIRKFVDETPNGSGTAIAGRAHYFDSTAERTSALGLNGRFIELNLNDFSENQVRQYLAMRGWTNSIPDWFPSRPLLLGYLAARKYLDAFIGLGKALSPAEGWNELLKQVSDREAGIESSGIDGVTVRLIIERLATRARSTSNGTGPLRPHEITEVFVQVCGYAPDDRGMTLLQRLPGLGSTHAEDGSRDFIDRDFLGAAQSGDVFRYIDNPYVFNPEKQATWRASIGELGTQSIAFHVEKHGVAPAKIAASVERAAREDGTYTLANDILEVMKALQLPYRGKGIVIRDVEVTETFLDATTVMPDVVFQDCYFKYLEIESMVNVEQLPRFQECYFGIIQGATSIKDLPPQVFDEQCDVERFGDSLETNDSIRSSSLPTGTQSLLTVLRKLYQQRGRARQESALVRGLDNRSRKMVPEILQLLVAEGLVTRAVAGGGRTVWVPVRSQTDRVMTIMSSPNTCSDLLLVAARNLK